jgi:hypothetical protein
METKGALRSLGVLGSLSSIGSLLAAVTFLRETWDSIPPELIEETKYFLTVILVATVQQAMALIGRWRAVTKIRGLL